MRRGSLAGWSCGLQGGKDTLMVWVDLMASLAGGRSLHVPRHQSLPEVDAETHVLAISSAKDVRVDFHAPVGLPQP